MVITGWGGGVVGWQRTMSGSGEREGRESRAGGTPALLKGSEGSQHSRENNTTTLVEQKNTVKSITRAHRVMMEKTTDPRDRHNDSNNHNNTAPVRP